MSANLILASQSPRRRQLLAGLGVSFTVMPAHVDETALPAEAPLAYVQRIARAKARKVAAENPGCVVLAADTPVIVGRRILQSPADAADAARMLRLMSNRRVHIPTAVCVVDAAGRVHAKLAASWVKFRPLLAHEIDNIVANPANWQGISGALQVESPLSQRLITTMHGSHSGILGLPLYETGLLLARAGIEVMGRQL